MVDGVNPGDIFINSLTLASPNGTLDMTGMFLSAEMYESIFTPGIMGSFKVLDMNDYIGILRISGGETVQISFNPPGGSTTTYTMLVNSVTDGKTEGSTKFKTYILNCVSKEAFSARANPVTKSYNTQISSIVSDVFTSYLGSSKSLSLETTKGIQKIISPNKKPLTLIKELSAKAVSASNVSSVFVFFENKLGYNFVTVQSLFNNSVLKNLVRLDTVGHSIYNLTDNNIFAYHLERQGGALDRIGLGSLSFNTKTYDARTNTYVQTTNTPSTASFGILNSLSSSFFSSLFGSTPGKNTFINKDSVNPDTYMSDAAPDKSAYLAALMQTGLNIEVPGDTVFYAGGMVNTSINDSSAITGVGQSDPLLNGQFLIAKVAHIIKPANIRPRYTCSMQLLKAGFDT